MIRLNDAPDAATVEKIRELYEAAFPKSEKKPFALMVEKVGAGLMEMIAVEDGEGEFYGLAITVLHSDIMLLDYFAIAENKRGRGVGTEVLSLLRERYSDKRFILEVEDPDEVGAQNREERVRRLGFYLRCGLSPLPMTISLFGVQMKLLCGGRVVNFEEYHEIFGAVFSEWAAKNVWLIE